ncbi:MAG TPA: hypothetical protein VI452_07075 [Marmoricola sp.]|jgi:hypothetical protein
MRTPLTEEQVVARSLVLLFLTVVVFALAATFCVGAGLLAGIATMVGVGWPLLGEVAKPVHLNVALGVAVASSLVTLWAS